MKRSPRGRASVHLTSGFVVQAGRALPASSFLASTVTPAVFATVQGYLVDAR